MSSPEMQVEPEITTGQIIDIMMRRRWIIIGLWAMSVMVTIGVVMTMIPVYQATTLVIIEKERGSGFVFANAGAIVETRNTDYKPTQYLLIKTRSIIAIVHKKLKLEDHPEFGGPAGISNLRNSVQVYPINRSRLVQIKATSLDPQLAAKITDTVSQTYVDANLENQLFMSKEILTTLQADPRLASTQALYNALPSVVNNALLMNLKIEGARLANKLAELKATHTAKHPNYIAIKNNIDTIDAQLIKETNRIVRSLKTELSGKLRGNNVRIIDKALVPEWPIKPQKTLIVGASIAGGLMLGLMVAYMIDTLDQSIRNEKDVEVNLRLPYLGAIPHSHQKASKSVYEPLLAKKTSLTSESFRNLRTMVDFAGVSMKSRSLLVTSTVQEEGKTYVASDLAVTFAQMGENVLLIDGDLRRPKLHKTFQLSAEAGLSTFLAKGHHVEDVIGLIQKTEIENLSVLPCGPRPPNPSELLNTPRLSALMSWAGEKYDRVIIDCTPMFPINDTLLWGRHVKAATFVIRFGKTRISLAQNALRKAIGSGIKILGIVLNGAKSGSLAYSDYGYTYYTHSYYTEPEVSPKVEAKEKAKV